MFEVKLTSVAEVHPCTDNSDLLEYVEGVFSTYSKAKRETYHTLLGTGIGSKSKYNTYLQKKYCVSKRVANSIINDAQTTLAAMTELRKYELDFINTKINAVKKAILLLEDKVSLYRKILADHGYLDSDTLRSYRGLKRRLVFKKNRLNKLTQKAGYYRYCLDLKKFKVCFGTKKLLKSNYAKFIAKRDSEMLFVGCKSETVGNQILQVIYDKAINQFRIRLRKSFGKDGDTKYVTGKFHLGYLKNEFAFALSNSQSISYRLVRKNGRYYIHCTFSLFRKEEDFTSNEDNGVIGVDFNKGFVAVAELNRYGNLVSAEKINYRFGSGNKTDNDLHQIAVYLSKLSKVTGKLLVIENLDFSKKKSSLDEGNRKSYNRMLSYLPYSRFSKYIGSSTYRHGVYLNKVRPYYTSRIAKEKYCDLMKLNVHVGAAMVIGRRSYGFD